MNGRSVVRATGVSAVKSCEYKSDGGTSQKMSRKRSRYKPSGTVSVYSHPARTILSGCLCGRFRWNGALWSDLLHLDLDGLSAQRPN